MNEILRGIAAASLGAVGRDDTGTLQGRFLFTENFAGFAGHFPGQPILPAVVQILTVASLVGEAAGCRQRLVAVEDAKFLSPVLPGQELLVCCRPRTLGGKLLYHAQLSVGEQSSSSILLELAGLGEQA
jgi:3-hydroxyacyl-[acyl-carrier-protein] dehydratase